MDEQIENRVSSILVGSLLGDGYLYPNSKRKGESQMQLKYATKSKEYLLWLKDKLQEEIPFNEVKKKKGYNQYYATSKPSKTLGKYRDMFYPGGKKTIPMNIGSVLISPYH